MRSVEIAVASNIVNNVTPDKKIKVEDLKPVLMSFGFRLSDEDVKQALKSTFVEADDEGKIEFKGLIDKLMKTKSLTKSQRIQNARIIVNNIVDGKVNTADVVSTLKSLGVELSKEKLAEIIKSIKTDENVKIEFLDMVNKLISSKNALTGQQLENVHTVLSNVTEGKVALKDLLPTLESLGIDSSDEAVKKTLKLIEPDDDGKVDLKDMVKQFIKGKKSLITEKIQKIQDIVSSVSNGMIHVEDLLPVLESFGIKLEDGKLKDTLESIGTDDDGAVNLKNFVKKLIKDEKSPKDKSE
ncbi:EF-hand calcium-binding domain-containing protein 13-like [Macrotis lagotis]|uniref:EF-hand calcium-binding domain-containing protein 13-like n=1 Tax=Macrotis lagotis TaxID=92651 RepID=UPI003D68093C